MHRFKRKLKELELDVKLIGIRTSDLESSTTAKLNDLKKDIKMNQKRNQDLSMRIKTLEKEEVMRESYSKRLKILAHRLKEPGQRWKPVGSTGWTGCRSGRDSSTGRSSWLKNRSNYPFWQLKDI